jgi:aminopeptidase
MLHPSLEKWAELLVDYCVAAKPGDVVLLNLDTPAGDLARALYRTLLERDAEPHLRLSYPELLEDTLELAPESYYAREAALELSEIKQVQGWIRVRAPQNSAALQSADKGKYARLLARQRPVQNVRVSETRWVGSLYPTSSLAQDAGMSLAQYEDFVFGAMFLFDPDPVARWREMREKQARLIERLAAADEVRIVGEGTDLRLRVGGRTWVNSDGRRNMPSGEVFTGPIEDSAFGVITFGVPSVVGGSEVAGVRLEFEGGKVVSARADVGDDMLQAQLQTDAGARFLGELGIGTNDHIQRATKQILFDEKIGGTVHLALGQSYRETGGVNESAIHWDMICDLRQGGTIYLDGEVFQENGAFRL